MRYLDKVGLSRIFIIIFHLVGLLGFLWTDYHVFFLSFVPFHLLLMCAILIANQKEFNTKLWQGAVAIAISGFIIEVIGVATGIIFGHYHYGATLGYKVAAVPLIIGINWLMLIFSVGAVLNKYFKHLRNLKSLIGAIILVFMDILIEPIAMRFDYWNWQDASVPFKNYVAWFIISFIMLRAYYELEFRKTNKVAFTLLLSQIIFFVMLNLTVL